MLKRIYKKRSRNNHTTVVDTKVVDIKDKWEKMLKNR